MTKKIKWRLKELPTPDELGKLIEQKLITKDEARQILFSEKDEDLGQTSESKSITLDSVAAEVKMLRELFIAVQSRPQEVIKIIERYEHYPWYKPYYNWCSTTGISHGVSISSGSLSLDAGDFSNITKASNSVTPLAK